MTGNGTCIFLVSNIWLFVVFIASISGEKSSTTHHESSGKPVCIQFFGGVLQLHPKTNMEPKNDGF